MLRDEIEGVCSSLQPEFPVPPQTELSGQDVSDILFVPAAETCSARPIPGCNPDTTCRADPVDLAGSLLKSEALAQSAVSKIVGHHRRYEDLRRAYQRIDLQVKAIKRSEGDGLPVEVWLSPYSAAMAPLSDSIKVQEKELAKLAKELPVHAWAKDIAGLSDRFLALIIGEAGRPIRDYRNPSCLWKRMGMAVIEGSRQRRVTGDAALVHGYVPRRRALMWNIGESILKQQLRKSEDGERYARGLYGQVYIDRRAYEVETKGEKYSHARAKRYMEKRLLRELWKAWPNQQAGRG